MSFASKYNKTGIKFDVDASGFDFVNLETLYKEHGEGRKYEIDALYINTKSEYGAHPVAVIEDLQLKADLPKHLKETAEEMLSDDEAIEAIRSGRAGFIIDPYLKNGKQCYGVRWIDLD